jgi:hypothetical protein
MANIYPQTISSYPAGYPPGYTSVQYQTTIHDGYPLGYPPNYNTSQQPSQTITQCTYSQQPSLQFPMPEISQTNIQYPTQTSTQYIHTINQQSPVLYSNQCTYPSAQQSTVVYPTAQQSTVVYPSAQQSLVTYPTGQQSLVTYPAGQQSTVVYSNQCSYPIGFSQSTQTNQYLVYPQAYQYT